MLLPGCVLLILGAVLGGVREAQGQQRFCGKTLTDALDLVCSGTGYNSKLPAQKRFVADFDAEYEAPLLLPADDGSYDNSASFPLSASPRRPAYPLQLQGWANLSPFLYDSLLAAAHRRRRHDLPYSGIYDECCRKSCSYVELAAYCRPI